MNKNLLWTVIFIVMFGFFFAACAPQKGPENSDWRLQHMQEWERNVLPTLPKMTNENDWKASANQVCYAKAKTAATTTSLKKSLATTTDGHCAPNPGVMGDNYSYVVFGYLDPSTLEYKERVFSPYTLVHYACWMQYTGGDKNSTSGWDIWDFEIMQLACDDL